MVPLTPNTSRGALSRRGSMGPPPTLLRGRGRGGGRGRGRAGWGRGRGRGRASNSTKESATPSPALPRTPLPIPRVESSASNNARSQRSSTVRSDNPRWTSIDQPSLHDSSPPHLPHSTRPNPIHSDPIDEDQDAEIIMAIDRRGRHTGCAYYTVATKTLSFMEDFEMPSSESVGLLTYQIVPTTILVPSRFEDAVPNQEDSPYRVHVRPAAEFVYDAAKGIINKMRIGKELGPTVIMRLPGHDDSNTGGLVKLAAWIDVESRVTVGCVGAVLQWAKRRQAIDMMGEEDRGAIEIDRIELVSFKGTMFINADTMKALQVFEDESHPNFHMQGTGGRGKEGLSLFGILNLTKSTLGKQMLRQWFLRPLIDMDTIIERHESIELLLKPENIHSTQGIKKFLKKVKNIPKTISSLKKGKVSQSTEWFTMLDFVKNAINLRNSILEMVGFREITLYQKIMNFQVNELNTIIYMIENTIDFAEADTGSLYIVRPGCNAVLDERKRFLAGLSDLLGQITIDLEQQYIDIYSGYLDVKFFTHLGYLIEVPGIRVEHPHADYEIEPSFCGPDWELYFASEVMMYYKNPMMRELDMQLGDTPEDISEMELVICHELKERVLVHEDMLMKCITVISELDCLVALAEGAAKYKFTRPTMTEQNILEITKGRHPLQELCVPVFAENDTHLLGGSGTSPPTPPHSSPVNTTGALTSEGPSLVLLTGPNYSGKSVYLKQVALVVYLAHIGSFVPAEESFIGITDKILTRLQTRETVSHIQSAFLLDLNQIALCLRNSTRNSLVIIDEFGKGTDSADGAGLACATLEEFLGRGVEAPKVLAATHFHEIIQPPDEHLPPQKGLAFYNMRINIDKRHQGRRRHELVTYLYTLELGRSGLSFGTICAALQGIDEKVVTRAEELIGLMAKGEDLVDACSKLSQAEEGELKVAEVLARNFLRDWDVDESGVGVRSRLEELLMGV